jgi:hypothetical protein
LGEEELNLGRAKTTEFIKDFDNSDNEKLQNHFNNLGNFMNIEGPNSGESSNNESIGFSSGGSSTNIFTEAMQPKADAPKKKFLDPTISRKKAKKSSSSRKSQSSNTNSQHSNSSKDSDSPRENIASDNDESY